MGRNIGGHAHGDARRTVEQQVGQPRRQQVRLLECVVEVGRELDGVLVEVFQQFQGDGRQPGLSVAHGRRAVAVDAAEVALTVDQGVTHGELLRQPHHRVVDRAVAVGVILAQHLADETRAFAVRLVGPQPHVVHGIENAPVDGLQAVTCVGQRPGNDDAHGVVQVGTTHLLINVDTIDGPDFQVSLRQGVVSGR